MAKFRKASHYTVSEFPSEGCRKVRKSSIFPVVFGACFLMDFIDWLSRGGELKTTSLDGSVNTALQSPIIAGMTFFRLMLTTFMASTATFGFITKHNISASLMRELDKGNGRAEDADYAREFSVCKIRKICNSRAGKIACFVTLYLAVESMASFIYYIVRMWINNNAFFENMDFIFIEQMPKGAVQLIRRTAEFLSQASILPIYLSYIDICIRLTTAAGKFNLLLEEATSKVTVTECVSNKNTPPATKPLPVEQQFDKILKNLRIQQEALITAVDGLCNEWSSVLACIIFGNLAILASLVSFCFTEGTNFAAEDSAVLFVGHITQPLVGLMIVVFFAISLQETGLLSRPLWRKLITGRQQTRDKVQELDEDGCLLTVLHATEHYSFSLKLSKTVDIDRGFGITMITGFLGFVCFLIERSENYRIPTSSKMLQRLERNHTYS